jgi:hypothetical protein
MNPEKTQLNNWTLVTKKRDKKKSQVNSQLISTRSNEKITVKYNGQIMQWPNILK